MDEQLDKFDLRLLQELAEGRQADEQRAGRADRAFALAMLAPADETGG